MNKLFFLIVVLIMSLLTGCGSSVRFFHDIDPSTDFANFSTYNFLDWTEGNMKTINELERERLRVAFAKEFESRGFVFQQEGADVSVQITVYHREKKDVYHSYSPYYYPYYNPYYGGGSRVYNHLERAISIDIYDNSARKHVWHSAAVGELDYDPQKRAEKLSGVANEMFKDFPRQKETEG